MVTDKISKEQFVVLESEECPFKSSCSESRFAIHMLQSVRCEAWLLRLLKAMDGDPLKAPFMSEQLFSERTTSCCKYYLQGKEDNESDRETS